MFRVLVEVGVPSVPADRPLPPALPQEQARSAGRLQYSVLLSPSQMGSSQTWRRPRGRASRGGGWGQGWKSGGTSLPPLGRPCGHGFSSPGLGHLWDHSWFLIPQNPGGPTSGFGGVEGFQPSEGSMANSMPTSSSHLGRSTPLRLLWLSRSPLGLLPQTGSR